MCGILGIKGTLVEKNKFLKSLDLQIHRGPDDSGYYQHNDIQLGHRRLSIIDIHHHSKQPMVVSNGDIVGVFNGEIYNYRELRAELITAGYQFKTSSDTEVLLNGFHYYGKAILDRLIGMFAFGIYDLRNDSLFLARDRLGIKPLFYTKTGKTFVFSSEIKSILSFDNQERALSEVAVSSFLSFRYPILNDTFYTGIQQLPPGHYMEINSRSSGEPIAYWSLKDKVPALVEGQVEDLGEEFYIERIRELFSSTVKYRMISDVPVGSYLSGGVDSSAVVAEMAGLSSSPVKTFTIGFEEEGYNEFEYARIVADLYKTDHHEITLSQDSYLETMQELISFKDAPLGVPNEVPLYLMSQTLKKHITVVLSGEGADEIFCGYGRIFRSADDYAKVLECRKNPDACPQGLADKIKSTYGNSSFTSELDHFLHLYRYTDLDLKKNILHSRFTDSDYDGVLNQRFSTLFESFGKASYRDKMMLAFETLHLPGLLQRVDVTTMAASVEARVPFVDHRLVEFAFTIPEKYKLKWNDVKKNSLKGSRLKESKNSGGHRNLLGNDISEVHDTPKYIFKKAMSEKLPDSILYRQKMGFPVPLEKWFGKNFRQYAASQILNGELIRRDILDKAFVSDFLKDHALEKNPASAKTAWMLLSLETFLRNY